MMSMKIINEYVDFEVDLDEWNDDELIEEIEDRGYCVAKEDPIEKELTPEELDHLRDMVINGKPGSIEWAIYNKIKKV